MVWSSRVRAFIAVTVCLVLVVPAYPQTGYGNIGPSKGEIAGVIAGAAAAIGVGAYLIYRGTHKHVVLQGCVVADEAGLSLRNDKDKRVYVLSGNSAGLQAGQRVALLGKKKKESGEMTFQVQKLAKDLGACAAK